MEPDLNLSNIQILGIILGLYLAAFAVYTVLDFVQRKLTKTPEKL